MEPLSLTGKRWGVRIADASVTGAGHNLLALLMAERGLAGGAQHHVPGLEASLFPDCAKATERVRRAVERREKVAIFGDYDCDGITSTAMLSRYFERRGTKPLLRLPHRLHEGYGLRPRVIEELHASGTQLLMTVDTGVTAVNEIAAANRAGMDVIVLDHHHLPPVLPDAYAILHPAVGNLPEPHPAAAGVTWSFVRHLEAEEQNSPWDGWDTDCALAAIGTVADLVELKGSNRMLVQAGLAALTRIDRGPLAMLRLQAGLQDEITSRDIAFRIAPRLNAAGRMADPSIALHAILGDEGAIMMLEELNRQRQELVKELFVGALHDAEQDPHAFIAISHPQYVPGICGLIAGKLTEHLGKPSLVAHAQGDTCVGSLRSVPAYNLMQGLRKSADLLQQFGGHAMAAGCAFAATNFETVRERMAADVSASVPPGELRPTLMADLRVQQGQLSLGLVESLRALEPHGQGNPEPAFLLENVSLRNTRTVGRDASHLQGFIGNAKLIGFGLGRFTGLTASSKVDLIGRLGIDTWNGSRNAQLMVDDMRIANPL